MDQAAPAARSLNVVTFLWKGWRPLYDARHVNALGRMLERHMSIPYRFVCFTNDPDGIEYETLPLWDDPHCPDLPSHHDSYRRLKLFGQTGVDLFPDQYILQMDLDCVILNDMAPLVTWDDFRILENGVTPYQGSMWLHKTGTRRYLWDDFDPMTCPRMLASQRNASCGRFKGSDQSWISYRSPGEARFTTADGVYRFHRRAKNLASRHGGLPPHARVVFFPGLEYHKPWSHEFRMMYRPIADRYMEFFR